MNKFTKFILTLLAASMLLVAMDSCVHRTKKCRKNTRKVSKLKKSGALKM